jgi:hypothetical protein
MLTLEEGNEIFETRYFRYSIRAVPICERCLENSVFIIISKSALLEPQQSSEECVRFVCSLLRVVYRGLDCQVFTHWTS